MKPVALVTGGEGFTGHYVISELKAGGYEVVSTSHVPREGNTLANLCDKEALKQMVQRVQPDVVVHLAAISFVAHDDIDGMYRTNIVGTRNLLESLASLSHRPRSVLLASSANVYGNSDVEVLTEDMVPRPANDYAVSKLGMEYMASLWMDRLPITLVRPFNYTGIGQSGHFLIPKIVSHFRRRAETIELGNINVARDFQDVRFVANAYCKILEVEAASGQVVNLCSGHAYTLLQVIRMMEAIAGYRIDIKVNPAFVRANEIARLTGSPSKLASLIGPLDIIPLQQTLQWMYTAPH